MHQGTWHCIGLKGTGLTTLPAQPCTAKSQPICANLQCTLSQRWDERENHVSCEPDNSAKCDQCNFTSYSTSSSKRHVSFAPDNPVNSTGEKCNQFDSISYNTSSLKRHESFDNLRKTTLWTEPSNILRANTYQTSVRINTGKNTQPFRTLPEYDPSGDIYRPPDVHCPHLFIPANFRVLA